MSFHKGIFELKFLKIMSEWAHDQEILVSQGYVFNQIFLSQGSAYVTPDVMYGDVSSTDFTFCRCTVFVGSSGEYILKLFNCCTILMAYDSALVIALYAMIE